MGAAVDRWLEIWSSGPELDFQVNSGTQSSGWQVAGTDFTGLINGFTLAVDRDVETGGGFRDVGVLRGQCHVSCTMDYPVP